MPKNPYKLRIESEELQILRCLNKRMPLPDKDKKRYFTLKKGYEGEVLFDSFTEKLRCDCLILNDLELKVNNTSFQIDSLIIIPETIFLYEVKNYEGDHYLESDRLYKKPKTEYINPLCQIERGQSLLRQLLAILGFNMPIDGSVVFINPEFTLYHAPLNKPIIFPTQVKIYLNKLDKTPGKLSGKHKVLADKLISLHIEKSPFVQLPSYTYDQNRKGITCAKCDSFSVYVDGQYCICKDCGHKETVESAVIRSVEEVMLLFPDQKITTTIIHDWCQVVECKKRISRILGKHFKIAGVHRWSYYADGND